MYKLHAVIHHYVGSHLIQRVEKTIGETDKKVEAKLQDSTWEIKVEEGAAKATRPGKEYTAHFKVESGSIENGSAGIDFTFPCWSKDNYVLMPAAAYNGNRFLSKRISYPPILEEEKDLGLNVETIISDVPRLNIGKGPSFIEQKVGAMSTPAIGFFSPKEKKGFFLLTNQNTAYGENMLSIYENEGRTEAVISLTAPGVRRDFKYRMCQTDAPSDDRGADFKAGDELLLQFCVYEFNCPDIPSLFEQFLEIRKDLTEPTIYYQEIPFYSAWNIQEDKYNKMNWDEKVEYYSVGHRENMYQSFQPGWVGGLMNTYPLLFEGSALSKERAMKTFEFVFRSGISPSGFFKSISEGEVWYSDNFRDPVNKPWHLVRKSADVLYYAVKQFMLLKLQDPSFMVPIHWEEGIKHCADAFVKLWDTYGQFGQFVNENTGEIIVGGSASGAMAPGGLALAALYFHEKEYERVAAAVAEKYYKNFILKGYTTGGPGEALQCPDSESLFGLLESFITLYETTGEEKWVLMAKDTANQGASWCVSYDYIFPEDSTFGRLNMHTTGSVYANAQNKHSAPGICTHSGVSLFKLYRVTGNEKYLELIKDIAHNLPQYLSRTDRPIRSMGPGWMNERVQMCDWLEPVGEIFDGSCWCEVSNMLTYVEVPGLYVQPDTGVYFAIDHIDTVKMEAPEGVLRLKLSNPTKHDAAVKVYIEKSSDMKKPMGQNALWGGPVVTLKAGEERIICYENSSV